MQNSLQKVCLLIAIPVRFITIVNHIIFLDIDECDYDLCDHSCVNLVGSYRCSCRKGYYLAGTYRCFGK